MNEPNCRECWLTDTVKSQAEQLRRAWASQGRAEAPHLHWWAMILVVASFVGGLVTMGLALSPTTPRLDYGAIWAGPQLTIVTQTMPVAEHETLVLTREGTTLRLTVMYDGVVRGTLLRVDTATRTLHAAGRPTAGWLVGGL